MPYTKKFANIYEQWVRRSPKPIRNWLKAQNEYLKKNLKRDSVVLDVGCGYGRTIKDIAKYHKEVWGIDISKVMIDRAKKYLRGFKNVHLKLEDAKKMSFPDGYFNYTVCTGNSFGNFGRNKGKILKEMKRVTREGRIVIFVYSDSKNTFEVRLNSYKKAGMKIGEIDYKKGQIQVLGLEGGEAILAEQFSKKQLKDIFKKAGLKAKIKPLTKIGYICEAIKEDEKGGVIDFTKIRRGGISAKNILSRL